MGCIALSKYTARLNSSWLRARNCMVFLEVINSTTAVPLSLVQSIQPASFSESCSRPLSSCSETPCSPMSVGNVSEDSGHVQHCFWKWWDTSWQFCWHCETILNLSNIGQQSTGIPPAPTSWLATLWHQSDCWRSFWRHQPPENTFQSLKNPVDLSSFGLCDSSDSI